MSFFLSGFASLSPQLLFVLIAGAMGGVVLGAIPGLGPAIAVAVLLPVSFTMDPLAGLSLLLGVYTASIYGGAVPAILINTPGTAVNVLTTFDGYPMAQRGQARRALGLAYSASFVGGMMSILALTMLSQPLARIAANFTSADYAAAAFLGLALVTLAQRGDLLAGVMMLGLGAFLSTVGFEKVFTSQRFTLDLEFLRGGIPLVPAVLGLFAISQAFALISGQVPPTRNATARRSTMRELLEIFRYPVTLFRSSGFGVMMGVLPGVGEWMAQFFSYELARRGSKTPEKFGDGAPEGLIAAEAANNAVPASAMVPLLSLGIPGEALTAMMMSVFLVHNVFPGPTLFETRPDFIGGLYVSMFLVNIFAVIFLYAITPWLIRICHLDQRIIGATIFPLVLVGTYSINYNIVDCYIALAFGVFGFAFKMAELPTAPVLIGMILGPIFEGRFRQAMSIANGDWSIFVTRPVSLGLLSITGIILLAYLYTSVKERKRNETES
jgi:putative tricarboxylic transport membrane protein